MDSRKTGFYTLGAIVFLIFLNLFVFSAPASFPIGTTITVREGMGLRSVSLLLKKENIIRSRLIFEAFTLFYGGEKRIIAADYFFGDKLPVSEVALRISAGQTGIAPVAITLPEGSDNEEIATLLATKMKNFDKEKFLSLAQGREGRLFPDTYFFSNRSSEEDALRLFDENYERKLKPLRPEISSSGHTEEEIIVMASIIEREADGDHDRAKISGILWKRVRIDMALQADAAPITYKERGLPKSAIANPGLKAILAAIHPENSEYLYYLHDKDGGIHYARNFEEHKANRLKYLNK